MGAVDVVEFEENSEEAEAAASGFGCGSADTAVSSPTGQDELAARAVGKGFTSEGLQPTGTVVQLSVPNSESDDTFTYKCYPTP